MTTELWEIERRLWTEGVDAFDRYMDIRAVMIFSDPAVILFDGDILDALDAAPRWSRCDMSEQIARDRDNVTILNYRATAHRADGPARNALCTSVWQNIDAGPRIVAHHQTSMPPAKELSE